MTPEGKVKRQLKQLISDAEQHLGHKIYQLWPVSSGMGRHGIPDCILGVDGFFVAIECKAPGKEPTRRQRIELRKIYEAGNISLVFDGTNAADVEKVFHNIINRGSGFAD